MPFKKTIHLLSLSLAISLSACAKTSLQSSTSDAPSFDALMQSTSQQSLKVATWNVEHLAYPIDTGCRPRTSEELAALRQYVADVDADIFALQEVDSKEAVNLLFPEGQWQIFMSPRPKNDPYECRGSGRESTQQKVAYAVKNGIQINSVKALSELALDNPGLRYGLELTVATPLGDITLLNVHMKSGCFVDNYSRSDSDACATFAKQAPILDAWFESKEAAKVQYIVLGDFNHRLSAPYNHLTQALFTNSDGSTSSLQNTTADLIGCHPYYPAPIDLIFTGGMQNNAFSFSSKAHDFEDMDPNKMLSDHCAVSLNITNRTSALSSAVKWQTTSKEYEFLTRAQYKKASESLEKLEAKHENWLVVMDVDETILDNSPYQEIMDKSGASYSPQTWAQWVKTEKAELVPGAAEFIQNVLAKGGKIALITNRDKDLDAHTWRNLAALGLNISKENTCLIGRSAIDKQKIDANVIINDKDWRREQVRNGQADCFNDGPTKDLASAWQAKYEIVMEVGDNIEDFTGVTQEDADIEVLLKQWPQRLILLPNPMYGSW